MNWRFENTGARSGVFNMYYDESLAQELANGRGNPTIRVYSWRPYAISLGWNQPIDEIDQLKANADGIDVVRRPTGGRAILHSEELTYSVVMMANGKNIQEVYNEISQALIIGLWRLGISVTVEKIQPHFPSLYKTETAAACFSSAGRYEIKCNGRKLVGSAQRRYATRDGLEVVLQHGSILIGAGHKQIVNYLNFKSEEFRGTLIAELQEKTTELNSELNRLVSFDEVADAVLFGFKKAWSIQPEIIYVNREEEKVIK